MLSPETSVQFEMLEEMMPGELNLGPEGGIVRINIHILKVRKNNVHAERTEFGPRRFNDSTD